MFSIYITAYGVARTSAETRKGPGARSLPLMKRFTASYMIRIWLICTQFFMYTRLVSSYHLFLKLRNVMFCLASFLLNMCC